MDSFALPITTSVHLYKSLKTLHGSRRIIHCRRKKVQAINSVFCGFFCIMEAMKRDFQYKNVTLQPFSQTLSENDQICINNIERMILA